MEIGALHLRLATRLEVKAKAVDSGPIDDFWRSQVEILDLLLFQSPDHFLLKPAQQDNIRHGLYVIKPGEPLSIVGALVSFYDRSAPASEFIEDEFGTKVERIASTDPGPPVVWVSGPAGRGVHDVAGPVKVERLKGGRAGGLAPGSDQMLASAFRLQSHQARRIEITRPGVRVDEVEGRP